MIQLTKKLKALSCATLTFVLVACANKQYVGEIQVVELVKQPEFTVLKVYAESPVVYIESSYQTVLCNGCEKNNATQDSDDVLWLRLTPAIQDQLIIADKHFDFDKSNLKGDLSKLQIIAERMKADRSLFLDVVGHTDSKGSKSYNQKLGQKRADAVKRWFVQQGIDSKRIFTTSKGENEPMASNSTADGRALNRRAVITINVEP